MAARTEKTGHPGIYKRGSRYLRRLKAHRQHNRRKTRGALMAYSVDTCRRCGRESPPTVPGPEGAAAQGWVTFEDREGNLYGTACPDHAAEVEADVAREQEAHGKGEPLPAVPDVFPESWKGSR
jgi:hypothetical protein